MTCQMMKTSLKIFFWTLVPCYLIVTSCKRSQIDALTEEPIEKTQEPERTTIPIDSAEAMSKLTASGRFWCIEQVTRTAENNTKDISEDTLFFTKGQVWYIHANVYRFGGIIEELPQENVLYQHMRSPFEYSESLSGKRPYGAAELDVRFAFILVGGYNGKWNWDSRKQTFSINFPSEKPLAFWKNETGYLDPEILPKYKNLLEAKAAGKPERIRIMMEVNDTDEGKVIYAYTLRAAWVVDYLGGYYKTNSKYSVLY